ncbi:MAG: hypothetical protein H6707_09405 [Deltaproteobacteria bacterium]|nr:hypothetical protein [Deltaproteobacteria bacterium]
MHRYLRGVSVVVAVLFASSVALAISPQGAKALQNVTSWLQKNDKIKAKISADFDGQAVTGDHSRLSNPLRDLQFNLKYAIRGFNSMSRPDRASAEGQEMVKQLKGWVAYNKSLATAIAGAGKAAGESKRECWAFHKEVQSPRINEMHALVRFLLDPKARFLGTTTPELIARHRKVAEEVHQICQQPRWQAIVGKCSAGKSQYEMNHIMIAKDFPVHWCNAAKQHRQLLVRAIQNFIGTDDSRRARVAVDPEKLARNEGWLAEDGVVTWKKYFFVTKEDLAASQNKYTALFAAAGGADGPGDDVFAERKAAKAKLRAAVEELAPKLETPAAGPSHYGVALATKMIRRWHPGAKIIKAFGAKSAVAWNIHKNAIGVPKYRDKFGYVLYRVPGEKWCQLRKFYISEDYSGGGRFQRAQTARSSSVRFQNCR